MFDLEGVILSDYLLLQCVSRGGVADVYRARQNGEGNYEVAVKVFRPGYAQRQSFREYFMSEAEKIGQFDHANILPFLEYGEGEELLYLVTPFVATGTLEDLLQRVGGRFSAMQALPIVQQLCSAVQYAHDSDVIHGNIKPTNVFVASDGRMLLSDFGIARSYDDSQQSLTRVGWGSAEYAAPEQSLGVLRRASDIYSLGVLLFRILTGSPPFTGQTPVDVLLKHVRQPPPSARSLIPNISYAVDAVLCKALQKRSDERFASAEDLSNAYLTAVTIAPVASPVSRTGAMGEAQTIPRLPLPVHMENPYTPLPAFNVERVTNNPQTPVPASLGLNSPTAQQAAPLLHDKPQTPASTCPLAENSDADITEISKKSFLQEEDKEGGFRFWSVDPAEWSPLAKESTGHAPGVVPLTASAYLGSRPGAARIESSPASTKKPDKQNDTTFGRRLKKLLPLVVVILLLLGLLGALLSAIFFPVSKPGASTSHPVSKADTTGTFTIAAPVRPNDYPFIVFFATSTGEHDLVNYDSVSIKRLVPNILSSSEIRTTGVS